MDWGGPGFVVALVALSYGAWVVNNWIRAKHGYELEDEWGGKTKRADTAESQKLREENTALKSQIDAMQDRMVVLEKIVTDRGYSLREEIEALRHAPADRNATGNGVPLNIESKEKA